MVYTMSSTTRRNASNHNLTYIRDSEDEHARLAITDRFIGLVQELNGRVGRGDRALSAAGVLETGAYILLEA